MMEGEAQANRVAAEVVSEFGVPRSTNQTVALLAYVYARGSRDGYEEAALRSQQAMDDLRDALLEAVS